MVLQVLMTLGLGLDTFVEKPPVDLDAVLAAHTRR